MKLNKINCQRGSTAVVKKNCSNVMLMFAPGSAWPGQWVGINEGEVVELLHAPKRYHGIANCVHVKRTNNEEGYIYWVDFIKFFEMKTIMPGVDLPKSNAEKLANKKNRMAEPGYYVEFLIDINGEIKENLSRMQGECSTVICIGANGTAKYIRYQSQDSWATLIWSAAPTRKFMETKNHIMQCERVEARYVYYKTHEELQKSDRDIANYARINKAPNDELI